MRELVHEPMKTVSTGISRIGVPEEERQRAYEAAWERGGVLFSKTFNDQLSLLESNDTARPFVEVSLLMPAPSRLHNSQSRSR